MISSDLALLNVETYDYKDTHSAFTILNGMAGKAVTFGDVTEPLEIVCKISDEKVSVYRRSIAALQISFSKIEPKSMTPFTCFSIKLSIWLINSFDDITENGIDFPFAKFLVDCIR